MPLLRHQRPRRRRRTAARAFLILTVILLLGGCGGPKRVRRAPPPPPVTPSGPVLVRIGLAEAQDLVTIACDGPWELQAGGFDVAPHRLDAADTLRVRRIGDAVAVDELPLPAAPSWLVASPVDPAHLLTWDGRPWRGELHVFGTPEGAGLTVANVLAMERYLAGVVPREIGGGRSPEDFAAVAAQAVAARNYTLRHLGRRDGRGFDLYGDVRDQAYGGVAWEDSLCNEALAATAGLVLRHDGELVSTYYHSTCGGHTAGIGEVWPYADDPVLCGRPDRRPDGRPWCAASRYATWRQAWTWDGLSATLQRTLPAYVAYVTPPERAVWGERVFTPARDGGDALQPGDLLDIAVRTRTREGRVAELMVRTTAGEYVVCGDRTRWVLQPPAGGSSLLRSAWFELEVERGRRVVATGRGWGHGLGLCQMGAIGRSRAGQGFREILAHYYPGARLEPVAGEILP